MAVDLARLEESVNRDDSGGPEFAGTVLVVEDDPDLVRIHAHALAPRYRVQTANSVGEALRKWRGTHPDALVIDLGLHDGSGIEVIVEVRRTAETPIMVVTGDSREETCLLALRLGADDFLVKPISIRELEARVDALLRRASRPAERGSIASYGALTIDTAARQVFVDGELTHLTATEFDLLSYLAAQPRQVFSREQLLDAVWRSSAEWQTIATVTEHTRRLRAKLGSAAKHIATVYGRGYRFDP